MSVENWVGFRPSRWFMSWAIGLMVFLCLAILMAALMLLRQGFVLREGIVSGSSMEPHLRGPRVRWQCSECSLPFDFALDTCRPGRAVRCPRCGILSDQPLEADSLDVQPGEKVQNAPLRLMRSRRANEISMGAAHPLGIARGDLVVVRESSNAVREIKRIVGFPGEQVAIEEGDLWIDGNRFAKTLTQCLRQAILISAWQRDTPDPAINLGAWKRNGGLLQGGTVRDESLQFCLNSGGQIDNQLVRNAHDTHRVINASDIGLAIQFEQIPESGKLSFSLNTLHSQETIGFEFNREQFFVVSERASTKIERSGVLSGGDKQTNENTWLVVAIVDGALLVGTPYGEFVRESLPPSIQGLTPDGLQSASISSTSSSDQQASERLGPIEIRVDNGEFRFESILVFRDIVYRGNQDSASQIWESANGIVVLGDNVSTSSDSRDRWPVRPKITSVRGVIVESGNAIEDLLKQR
ncbi:MAG: S26 family signal peptidase [Pirellula sp.]